MDPLGHKKNTENKNEAGQSARPVGIAMKVSGFPKITVDPKVGEQQAIAGKNVFTGEDVVAILAKTNNPQRKDIDYFMNPYKTPQGKKRQVKEGGVVFLDRAYQRNDIQQGLHIAYWLNNVEGDPGAKGAKEQLQISKCCTVAFGVNKETKNTFGYAYDFKTDPESLIQGNNMDTVLDSFRKSYGSRNNNGSLPSKSTPFYLVRYTDEKNNVIDYDMLTILQGKEGKPLEEAEAELKEVVPKGFRGLQKDFPGVRKVNIVPGERYVFSQKVLNDGKKGADNLERFQKVRKASLMNPEDPSSPCLGRPMLLHLNPMDLFEEDEEVKNRNAYKYINNIHVHGNAETPAINPVTIGGLEYAPKNNLKLPEEVQAEQENTQPEKDQKAPVENEAATVETPGGPVIPDDPYASLGDDNRLTP